MNKDLKILERGWAGHFICAYDCRFRRNTLIEYKDIKVVVSTVGNMIRKEKTEKIGHNRYYETFVFMAEEINGYIEADVSRLLDYYCDGLCAESPEKLLEKYPHVDNTANDMHENIVELVCGGLTGGKIK